MPQPSNNNAQSAPSGGPGRRGNGAVHGRIRIEKGTGKTIVRLLSYINKGYMGRFVLAMCCMAVSSVVGVVSSLFLRTVIDDYITPMLKTGSTDFSGLLRMITLMITVYCCGIVTNLVYNLLLVRVSHGVLNRVRREMFDHMQSLPIRYFDTNSYGDIMSRYTNDTDSMRQMLSQSIPQVLSSLISIVSILIAMISLSIPLTLTELCAVVVMYFVTITIGGRSSLYFGMRQKALGETNGYMEEMINGQKVVKVFCYEDEAKAAFDERNDDLRLKSTRANIFANILMPIMGNIGTIMYVVLALVGGWLAVTGRAGITLGTIASFLTLARSFNMPVANISQQINSVVMALAGARRVFGLIDERSEEDEGQVTLVWAKDGEDGRLVESKEKTDFPCWRIPNANGTAVLRPLRGDIQMDMVDFSYREGHQILYDISLYAKPGQKIAFVGSTGAGKTTITNLINRFYSIEDGKIRYDNININNIRLKDLRSTLGMVLQDTNLFTGTVRDNIRYGRLDATDEEITAAAKLANAHDFIMQLPQGYNTVISGTGSQLSQGQCQLLSIARCAVSDPTVMILDEATSSVDTRTETLIQEGMDKLMGGRTTLVIAHRLSTVQNSNAIMVLEKGHIIERGDHDDLIEQKGRYYQLCTGKTE